MPRSSAKAAGMLPRDNTEATGTHPWDNTNAVQMLPWDGAGPGAYADGERSLADSPVMPGQAPLPPLDDLVAGINTVGFAPGSADEAQAERAGRQAVDYATALRSRRSWWRRAWWSVHPGPLRWRRRG